MSAYSLPRCSKCGNSSGPWRPTGETLPESDEQALVCSTGCPAELAAAIDAMGGALPMPVGTVHTVMTPEQRKAIVVQIGEAKPATDALVGSFAESVANVRNHEHPSWEDLYCMNLTSYMGERMAPVLRRLLDAENEVVRLRARVAELEAQAGQSRTEAIADVGDWFEEIGEKDTAYLVRTHDIPAARTMRVVSVEDPHDSPLHHTYATPRDLPEVTR